MVRHPEVSAWFPMLLVAYPVGKRCSLPIAKDHPWPVAGMPDGLHFHMLRYKRLVRWMVGSREAQHLLHRNSRTSPYSVGCRSADSGASPSGVMAAHVGASIGMMRIFRACICSVSTHRPLSQPALDGYQAIGRSQYRTMSTYAIGDIQGCQDSFLRLFDVCRFDPACDRGWLAIWSIAACVRWIPCDFVKSLGDAAITVLGNHDPIC